MPINRPERSGFPYRPSNGTEGEIFMSAFCDRCAKQDDCDIPIRTMGVYEDDPEYPTEWVFDSDGDPTCTAFEPMELQE